MLLSSDTVLTAAHCRTSTSRFKVMKISKAMITKRNLIQVVLGEHDVTKSDGEQRITPRYHPSRWISHPSYSTSPLNNDFAIIKLSTPVTFSDRVKPICLPSVSTNYDSKVATVTGWGTLSSGGSQPSVLIRLCFIESSFHHAR